MKRTTLAAVWTAVGSVVVAALAYAAVVSAIWVFAVIFVMPATLLAASGLGATLLTDRRGSRQFPALTALGILLAVAGAALAVGYFILWGLQFDYVDANREVPPAMDRWDQITFVGSAVVCAVSVVLALAVLARAWSRPSDQANVSTLVEGPDTSLSIVRYWQH